MADLSQKLEMVLDKLYNLKGEENVIIAKINRDIQDTEAAIRKAEEDQKNNEANKVNSEEKLQTFLAQKQMFEETFSGLNDDTFAALKEIGLNVEIGTMTTSLKDKSPEYVSSLENEIQKYTNAIESLSNKKSDLTLRLADHESAKIKAEEAQQRLISLLEQSLSNDAIERESLAVHHVKGILTAFEIFTDDEISKLSKLIIFPDEGLITYDRNYETRMLNLNSRAVEEPEAEEVQEITVEEHNTQHLYEEEPKEEQILVDEEPVEDMSLESLNNLQVPVEEPELDDAMVLEETEIDLTTAPEAEEIKEEVPVEEPDNRENLEEFLVSIGLDLEGFVKENNRPVEEIYKKLDSVDRRIITENYETLRSIGIYDGVLYQLRHLHMYLADKELNKKLTLLRAKGVSEAQITKMAKNNNSGLRESYDTLEKRIIALENVERKIDDDNAYVLGQDVEVYEKNLDDLTDNGFELDEKEIKNHKALLFKPAGISEKAAILKSYLISIVRKNGKYALNVFWKNPDELLSDIDSLIENDLENLIATNPEVLGYQISQVIGRVKYCEEHGEPIYEGNGNAQFCDYITDCLAFKEKFGKNIKFPDLVDRKENNYKLAGIIGNEDYVEILVNTLDAYYASTENCLEPALDEETKQRFEQLIAYFEEQFKAQITGKHTYKIGNVCISKNKLERNVSIILSSMTEGNVPIDGVEKEILLTAALYNLRQDEEILKSVVGSCLGFNEENTLGGKKL